MTPLPFTCVEQKRYRVAVTSLLVAVLVCVFSLLNFERSKDLTKKATQGLKVMTTALVGLNVTTTALSAADNHLTTIHCIWSPTSEEECLSLLSARLAPQRQLWLFFGDSTMRMLVQLSPTLTQALIKNPQEHCPNCNTTYAERCRNNDFFGLSIKENWTWVPPGPNEGPVANGKEFPHCLDCFGCLSRFLNCPTEPCLERMGAYFSVEFARDVELQSQEYNTTQENVVHFLKGWMPTNTSATSNSTTCILNFAIHDVLISNISNETYYDNIEWFLGLLDPLCGRFVWLHTTAPVMDYYVHTIDQMYIWNEGVLDILMTPRWQEKSTVVDLFNASRTYQHSDNVHLSDEWYIRLGNMLAKLI